VSASRGVERRAAAGVAGTARRYAVLAVVAAFAVVATPGAASLHGQAPVAADTVRLAELHRRAIERDPRGRQLELHREAAELRLRNLEAARLPQFRLRVEASRQSDVARLPLRLPGVTIADPPRSRYESALQTDWLVYDGGALSGRAAVERAELLAAEAELAATLHPLRTEVSESYFATALYQERLREADALRVDLGVRLDEARAQVRAGWALPGDTAALLAELLRVDQQRGELVAGFRAAAAVLGSLSGVDVGAATTLLVPDLSAAYDAARSRPAHAGHPQHAVFEARRERLARQAEAAEARLRPQLSVFGYLAYGRPGQRMFTDELHAYWLGGARLQWAPWDWRTTERERAVVQLQRAVLATEAAAFEEQLARQAHRPEETVERLRAALALDARIVALREQVERQARAQLDERAITPAAYVAARLELQDARASLLRHRIELARAQAEYLTLFGGLETRP
jgi:outer membrane protein TolC